MGGSWQTSPEGGGGWGGGVLEPKSPKVCVPTTAQINISFCKISFFPTVRSGSGGGGVLDPPLSGDAEFLSKTLEGDSPGPSLRCPV